MNITIALPERRPYVIRNVYCIFRTVILRLASLTSVCFKAISTNRQVENGYKNETDNSVSESDTLRTPDKNAGINLFDKMNKITVKFLLVYFEILISQVC